MKLKAFVYVNDDRGVPHAFGPGDEPPAWAAKKITNPKAWASGDTSEPVREESVKEPPKAGPGSGKDAWVKYATARGLADDDVDGLTRDEIIELFQES